MAWDPLYQKILTALRNRSASIDPTIFESRARAMLERAYPGLFPVSGGSDAGMDGGLGNNTLLVCTTSDDLIGNLTKNLEEHKKRGDGRTRVVFATSRTISFRKLKNLGARATELGFELIGTHGDDYFALALLQHPRFCNELLGIAFDPPALSALPRSPRHFAPHKVHGRENELAQVLALAESRKDLVVSGQPGSGKTCILSHLVEKKRGLFVVRDSIKDISQEVREVAPEVVLVEDAHVRLQLLQDLVIFRRESGATFSIAVDTWPGSEAEVSTALQLPPTSQIALRLLTLDEIAEVVRNAGLGGPDFLIHEIVRQAEGKPGLATTLASAALNGSGQAVYFGEELLRLVKVQNGSEAPKICALLSVISLGGDKGLDLRAASQALGISHLEGIEVTTKLAQAGIVSVMGEGAMSVRPPSLRYVLVRDQFSEGPLRIGDFECLCHDRSELCKVLVVAQLRGARFPDARLKELLHECDEDKLWEIYAHLGASEAKYVLTTFPERAARLSAPLLSYCPDETLNRLFALAVGDDRETHSNPGHPLRLIEDWAGEGPLKHSEALARRGSLLNAVCSWLRNPSNDPKVAFRVIPSIFSPGWNSNSSDPGAGMTITLSRGLVPESLIDEFPRLWTKLVEVLAASKHRRFVLAEVADELPGISFIRVEVPTSFAEKCKRVLRGFIESAAPLLEGEPAAQRRLAQIAKTNGLDVEVPLNREFMVLHPLRDPDLLGSEVREKQSHEIQGLASDWAKRSPSEVLEILAGFMRSSNDSKHTYPDFTFELAHHLAKLVDEPLEWLKGAVALDLPQAVSTSFIREVCVRRPSGWEEVLAELIQSESWRRIQAIEALLQAPEIPEKLLELALSRLRDGDEGWLDFSCRGMSKPVVRRLLRHRNPHVAGAVAIGTWESRTKNPIDPDLLADWRTAMLGVTHKEHWLLEILKSDQDLCFDWIKARLADQGLEWRQRDEIQKASAFLDSAKREALLELIPDDAAFDDIVRGLVSGNADLYRKLLGSSTKRKLHLAPLEGLLSPSWVELAVLALEKGYSVDEIASATYARMRGGWGPMSKHVESDVQNYAQYLEHPNSQIASITKLLHEWAEASRQRHLEWEQREAIYGRS
jgi:hypothetical protein